MAVILGDDGRPMSVGDIFQQTGTAPPRRPSGGSGGSGGSDQPQSIRDEEIFLATGQNVQEGSEAAMVIRARLEASEIQRTKTQERAKEIAIEQERLDAFRSLSKAEQVRIRRQSGVEGKLDRLRKKKPDARLTERFARGEKTKGARERLISDIKKSEEDQRIINTRSTLFQSVDPLQGEKKSTFEFVATPSMRFEDIERTSIEAGQGRESVKFLFTGGLSAISQKLKTSTRNINVKLPIFIGAGGTGNLGSFSPERVAGSLIPTTPLEIGAIGAFPFLPKVLRIGGATTVSGVATTAAVLPSSDLTKEERIASGLIGVTAGAGALFEATPFLRAAKIQTIGRLKGKFSPVRTQKEGFSAIVNKETPIGLIPSGSPLKTGETLAVKLPPTSPLKRGGFGVKQGEKVKFLGKQDVATSQRGLFELKKEIPAEKELYVTPQEPNLKIPQTRISRLGLEDPLSLPKGVEIGFGVPPKPQIGIEFGAVVSRTGKGNSFAIGTGSELEAIKISSILPVRKLGDTIIRGQGVEIFEIKTGTPSKIPSQTNLKTYKETSRVSGESTLALRFPTSSIKTPTLTSSIKTSTSKITSKPVTFPSISLSSKTTKKTSPITSLPTTKLITRSPTSSLPTSSTRLIGVPPTPPPPTTPTPPTTYKTPSFTFKTPSPKLRLTQIKQRTKPSFVVSIRRRGVFKPIGTGLTLQKAFELGRGRTSRTLAATFKVRPMKGTKPAQLGTPKGFKMKVEKKEGIVFIEQPKLRLSKPGEVKGIQLARRR